MTYNIYKDLLVLLELEKFIEKEETVFDNKFTNVSELKAYREKERCKSNNIKMLQKP